MGASSRFDLSLFIKAIDGASAPIRKVNGQIDKLTAPFKALGGKLEEFGKLAGLPGAWEGLGKVGSAFKEVGSEVFNLVKKIGLIGLAAGAGLYEVIKSSIDAGNALSESSKRVGLSADAYAQLRYAMEQSGVSQESFAAGMDKFNKSLGDLKAGSGPLVKLLKEASPALLLQLRHTKTTAEATSLMVGAFTQLKDKQQIASLSGAAFGKTNLQMGFAMHKGSAALMELGDHYLKIAGSQDEFAESAEKADKQLKESETAFEAMKNAAVTGLLPAVIDLSKAFTQFVIDNRDGIVQWAKESGKAIQDWIAAGNLTQLRKDISSVAQDVKDFVEKMGGMKGVAIAAAFYLGAPLLGALANLGAALINVSPKLLTLAIRINAITLGPVIALFAEFFEGITLGIPIIDSFNLSLAANPIGVVVIALAALAAAAYEVYIHWADLKLIFGEFWDWIAEKFKNGWAMIKPYVDKLAAVASLVSPGFGGMVDAFVTTPGDYYLGGDGKPIAKRVDQPSYVSPVPPTAMSFFDGKGKDMHLVVDFNNAPPGTRVATDATAGGPSVTTNVDKGHSMRTP